MRDIVICDGVPANFSLVCRNMEGKLQLAFLSHTQTMLEYRVFREDRPTSSYAVGEKDPRS